MKLQTSRETLQCWLSSGVIAVGAVSKPTFDPHLSRMKVDTSLHHAKDRCELKQITHGQIGICCGRVRRSSHSRVDTLLSSPALESLLDLRTHFMEAECGRAAGVFMGSRDAPSVSGVFLHLFIRTQADVKL